MRHPGKLRLWIALATTPVFVTFAAEKIHQWDFDDGNLDPSAGGAALEFFDGPGAATESGTQFGITTGFGIPNLGGAPASVMKFPACSPTMGFSMPVPATANGPFGAGLLNDYTLVMDVLFTGTNANAFRALVQTDDPLNNANDADFFINSAGGIGSSLFVGQVRSNTWHRIGFVVSGTFGEITKYVDGAKVGKEPSGSVDGRWALNPGGVALLFSDNNGQTAEGYVNSIQLRDRALGSGEMQLLGTASAAGIPMTLSNAPAAVEYVSPEPGELNISALPSLAVLISPGNSAINLSSVVLSLDGNDLATTAVAIGGGIVATSQVTTALAPLSMHQATVRYSSPQEGLKQTNWLFTVQNYQSVHLPAPIFLETFDGVAEGTLPSGWSVTNFTTSQTAGFDLNDPTSDAYRDFVVLESGRWTNVFGSTPTAMPTIALNDALLPSLVSGNFLYATSVKRANSPSAQVNLAFSPDYNLTGQTNVYLSFHSIYEQNQDSVASVEYSVDGGTNWLPALYMVDQADILKDGAGNVDAVATLSTARADQPFGSSYGSFLGAPVSAALAPFISGRVNDDSRESKRIEILRLAMADNQPAVRLRFLQAGTASYYFGLDDVGFYSIATVAPPTVAISPNSRTDYAGNNGIYFISSVQGAGPLSFQWNRNGAPVYGKTDSMLTLTNLQFSDAGTYTLTVRNAGGAVTSAPVALVVVEASSTRVVGQWDFESGDLRATIGNDLQFFDLAVQTNTLFGTTTSFGIADLAGQPAPVMFYSPVGSKWNGFVMTHGAGGNGGGNLLNQYTIIFDLLYPSSSSGKFRSLLQTSPMNSGDADLFINSGNGIGISSSYQGNVAANVWNRIAVAIDLSGPGTSPTMTKYVNGVKVGQQILSAGLDGRWALLPTALLFADDSGETKPGYVSSIQIRTGRMTDAAIEALGSPTAGKIPGAIKAVVNGGNLQIHWTGNVLESSASVSGPWSIVNAAARPYLVTPSEGQLFFRCR